VLPLEISIFKTIIIGTMNVFYFFVLFVASQAAVVTRNSCEDIMTGLLCLKFQKKQYLSCKFQNTIVVSENVACIEDTKQCMQVLDICVPFFRYEDTTSVMQTTTTTVTPTPTTKKELPLSEEKVVVLKAAKVETTTTTTSPTTKPPTKKEPLPVKEPVVLLQVKESVVPTTTTTTTVTQIAIKELLPPIKKLLDLTAKFETTTTETPTTTITPFGRFLLDRFHLKFSSLLESARNTQVKIV